MIAEPRLLTLPCLSLLFERVQATLILKGSTRPEPFQSVQMVCFLFRNILITVSIYI